MDISENQYTWTALSPRQEIRPNFWIPDRFRNKVIVHIIKNNLFKIEPPLILGIQGSQGDGKSSQTREVCSQLGAYVVPVSGSALSGAYEKDSVNALKSAYIYASTIRETKKSLTVLLIDDFDLSVASIFENSRNTVNTQLLCGFLMNLCDNPTICEDKTTHRIPIVITGNNFTDLHPPLTRHGRMDIFDWVPTIEEKTQIVSHIYQNLVRSEENGKIQRFVKEYKDEPLSFFSSVLVDVLDNIIFDIINKSKTIDIKYIQSKVDNLNNNISIEQLTEAANKRQQVRTRNYLHKSGR